MEWQTASQVATAFSAIIAAFTLASAFYFFRHRRRDEHAKAFSTDLVMIRTRFDQMKELVSDYGFSDEIAASVVNNPRFDGLFDKLHRKNQDGAAYDRCLDEFKSRQITVSVHSPLVAEYESWIKELAVIASRYEAEFRGFFRVLWAVHHLFRAVVSSLEQVARDEGRWLRTLPKLQGIEFDSPAELRAEFAERMWEEVWKRKVLYQGDIDDLSEVLELTVKVYHSLSPKELLRQKSREKSTGMAPLEGAKQITDLLVQAQIPLRHIMTESQLFSYRELISRFDARRA